ncbi:hypothetical protein [Microcoleus sp. w1-18aA5]|uniref:hypothetical protein n=1 Tax=Microcoleus sp. w1-18aA5 TaxID=2818982 RepID=UPI002FD691FA
MERRVLFCPLESKQKAEGSSATDCVTDVTDVTDIRKKEEGKCSRSNSFSYQECPKCQDG